MIKHRQDTPKRTNHLIRSSSVTPLENLEDNLKQLNDQPAKCDSMTVKGYYSMDDSAEVVVKAVSKISTNLYANLTTGRRKSSSVIDLYRIANDTENFVALCSVQKHDDGKANGDILTFYQ